ncbi:MAG: D-sedoheptulose 7-phosphate isomerase [Bacteroidales bacterium]|nr:D-sedoheptulose 7-phosphate isomerase [Bacteroidales bacterium]
MIIKERVIQSIQVKQLILENELLIDTLRSISQEFIKTFQNDGKVFFCGNGGSAADAQHLAAELSGRYNFDRPPLYSEALHVNSSFVTAVANDYSYDEVYARMIDAAGRKGDILVAISTSGNSTNIIKALERAKERGMITVAMTGETGGEMKDSADFLLNVPSQDTPRIQESHILLGHIICEIVETQMFQQQQQQAQQQQQQLQ